jgi:hypothetical protein
MVVMTIVSDRPTTNSVTIEKIQEMENTHKHTQILVNDTETEVQSRHQSSPPAPNKETLTQAYNAKVLIGRLRSAVRTLTRCGQGGTLQPDDACTKSGHPVLEVLWSKHPAMRDLALDLQDPTWVSLSPMPLHSNPFPS